MDNVPVNKPIDEMSPGEWFVYIRHKYDYGAPFNPPRASLEDFLSRLPASDKEVTREVWMRRYKMKMSEIHDELMQQYLQRLMPIFKTEEKEIVETTFFGILPTHDFNGYAGFTPRGDRVIILHEGLAHMLDFWSSWYLRVLDEAGKDFLIENPEKLYVALSYILAFWYGSKRPARLPDIYPKNKDSWDISECLTFASIAFVLGHELGHVLFKHSAYTADRDRNHAMEYDADRVGLSISIRHSIARNAYLRRDNYYPKFMFTGPLFATAVMSLLGDSPTNTHPSASDRMERLIAAYDEELRAILGKDTDAFVKAVDEDIFTILRNNSRRLFEVFAGYRDMMTGINIGPRTVDNTWLRSELKM